LTYTAVLSNGVRCEFCASGVRTKFPDGASYFGEAHYTPEHTARTVALGLLLNRNQTWLHEWLHAWLMEKSEEPWSSSVIWRLADNKPVDQSEADHEEAGVIAFAYYMRTGIWTPSINRYADYPSLAIEANREFEEILLK
jgi:hypothetical protein